VIVRCFLFQRSFQKRKKIMHINGDLKVSKLPFAVLFFLLFSIAIVDQAVAEYGDIVLNSKAEAMREAEVDDVLFPHWFHRIRYRCSVCHEKIFTLKAGSNDISISAISIEHQMCGTCHNGTVAWEALECDRCHSIEPGWSAGPIQHSVNQDDPSLPLIDTRQKRYTKLYEIASGWHPLALTDSGLPLDKYGLVDWAAAVREDIVNPIWSLDPNADPKELKSRDTVIVFESKGDFMPDVAFPHDIHSYWLQCNICHRSEEHTSELQSRQYLVCRLLLEKKTTKSTLNKQHNQYT